MGQQFCPRANAKSLGFEIYFGDRLAGLNTGEDWGEIEISKITVAQVAVIAY
jgi:hypothetical protein